VDYINQFVTRKNATEDEISFPWMQDSKWYPLAVWFYTIRNTLIKENISPWQPQEIIRRNFDIDVEKVPVSKYPSSRDVSGKPLKESNA
jgi:hypothetical protein